MNKKGQVFDNLGKLGIGVASLAVVLVVTFIIMAQAKTQIGIVEGDTSMGDNNGSLAWNATRDMQAAVDDIPGWVPIVIITAIGAILLSLVKLFRQ